MNIFGDTVALQTFTEPYSVIEIKNPSLANTYRHYFDLLWQNTIWTLQGESGAEALFTDTLQYKDVYWIGGNGGVEQFYPSVWNAYKKKRLEHKVFWHDLIDPGMSLSGVAPGTTIFDEPYYEHKFLPASVAGPHVIAIYGNKVANIVWEGEGVFTIMENEAIAEGYKKYFNFLWNQEVKTYRGWKGVNARS